MDLGEIVSKLPDENIVCRCEEIRARDIRTAIAEGAHSINDVKRRTRAGMGVCQGIFCARSIASMTHTSAGEPFEKLVPMTSRPPARMIPLAQLAATEE